MYIYISIYVNVPITCIYLSSSCLTAPILFTNPTLLLTFRRMFCSYSGFRNYQGINPHWHHVLPEINSGKCSFVTHANVLYSLFIFVLGEKQSALYALFPEPTHTFLLSKTLCEIILIRSLVFFSEIL